MLPNTARPGAPDVIVVTLDPAFRRAGLVRCRREEPGGDLARAVEKSLAGDEIFAERRLGQHEIAAVVGLEAVYF